ncbi:hypothetical protein [Reyranella sp.]|uniref:hypothetical protein n=1 Tax=Reyranella sp. TaxID=1929291 RepID=UPI003BAB520C
METILQRIVWNTRGWRMPSGATDEGGFPSETGFGHEEWNFQREDAFRGEIFGYTYSTPAAHRTAAANGQFRIVFFTIHPTSKERLVAGIYHAARLIPEATYAPLLDHFSAAGILERRALELEQIVDRVRGQTPLSEIKDSIAKRYLAVSCPVQDVETLSQLIPLEQIAGQQSVGARFRRFTYLKEAYPGIFQSPNPECFSSANWTPLAEDAYYREAPALRRVIIPRHKRLSNAFCKWLHHRHNLHAQQERDRVDVRFNMGDDTVLAEIKICYGVGTTKAIREALGQLLEYNHYPLRRPSRRWMIVLDEEPSTDDKRFVDLLGEHWQLPLSIAWREGQEFSFYRFSFDG